MLRRLNELDIPTLAVIEQQTQPSPWTPEIFRHCLAAPGCEAWGYLQDDRLLGFVLFSLRVTGESHLFNLCVLPDYWRQGIGSRLLQHAISIATQSGATVMHLEVRRSNLGAVALYHHAGFNQIGERKNYYPGPDGSEDAITFALELGLP